MKQIIITFFFTVSVSFAFAQYVFTVIDIKNVKESYAIVSARDDSGRTIQFQVAKGNPPFDKMTNKAIKPLTVGSKVTADFASATVSQANYKFIKYKIIKPPYFQQCCSIKTVQFLMSDPTSMYARITVKQDATNELSVFAISKPFTSNVQHLQTGQAIYEKHYNKKRYAVLKPWAEDEVNKNIFYSYEFTEAGNSPQTTTDTSQGTFSIPIDSTIYNQPWELTGTCNQYINTGTLNVNTPVDAECSIKIYNSTVLPPAFVDSSSTKRLFQLFTSYYNVIISGVKISNVPVCGLNQTRIKAGALNIISSSNWTLYDSNKVNTIYSSQVPKKVEFPRGIYQLEMNGTTQQIQIKDGETLQIGDSTSAPQTQKLNTGYQPWEIQKDPTIKGIGGEITVQIPQGLRYNTHLEFFNAGEKTNRQASWFGNNKAKLLPGMYDVVIDSRDTIKNVPVELGKQTRLKMGVFMVSGYSNANLENSSSTHQKFTYGAPFKILLPEGTYYLNKNKKVPIVIKDGELTEL